MRKNTFNSDSTQTTGLFYLKACFLLFWCLWFGLAALTNFFDLLFTLQILPQSWLFKSNNYILLSEAFQAYTDSKAFVLLIFFSDIGAQALSSVLFFLAFVFFISKRNHWPLTNLAFIISIALWCVFLVMDEIFLAYIYEAIFLRLLVAETICLLAIHLLPDEKNNFY